MSSACHYSIKYHPLTLSLYLIISSYGIASHAFAMPNLSNQPDTPAPIKRQVRTPPTQIKLPTVPLEDSQTTSFHLSDDTSNNNLDNHNLDHLTPTDTHTNEAPNKQTHPIARQALTHTQKATPSRFGDQHSLNQLATLYQRPNQAKAHLSCQGAWFYPDNQPTPTNGKFLAQADYAYYDNADYAEFSGNAKLWQDDQRIHAQTITHHAKQHQIQATGDVLFTQTRPNSTQTNFIGIAQTLTHNTQNKETLANEVAFASSTPHAHGYAHHIHSDDQKHTLTDVMFSTCPPDQRQWQINANQITLDSNTGRAIAKNATLKIHDIPVLKLPYFNFPIDTRRASGFLLPTSGFNNQDGLAFNLPYYLNLAPNYDVTLTPTIFTNRNPMLSAQVRYLSHHYGTGTLNADYLFYDKRRQRQNRHRLFYDHQWQSTRYKNLNLNATYRHVSDSDYLSDFDNLNPQNNALNLPRNIIITYHNPKVQTHIKFESFQKLTGKNTDGTPITDKNRPYARLPQIHINYTLPKPSNNIWSNIDIKGINDTAYFKKSIKDNSDTEKSGLRIYNQLTASRPIIKNWGYLIPKISLSHLYMSYDEDSRQMQSLSKKEGTYTALVPSISLDAGLHFQKSGRALGFDGTLGGYQILSPRLKYLFSPHKDQSDIPIFDTTLASISYEQLLSDSWFLGYDRLPHLHAITPALNYRYIDPMGVTRLNLGLATQQYLGKTKINPENSHSTQYKNSGMAWQASWQPKNHLWLDMQGSLTPNNHLNAITLALRYQPKPNLLLNAGMIERKVNPYIGQIPLSAYTASAVVPLDELLPSKNSWQLIAQGQYDTRHRRFMEAMIGLNYEDCCLGVSIYSRQYRNDLQLDQKTNRAIMAEIRLGNLASNGGRLKRLLAEKILGFDTP